jgi:hypothetical protein
MKNSCKHQKLIEVKTSLYNHYTGEEHIEVNWLWEDTFKDIDTHRYKCTQCGEIQYYSGAAKDYYTKGIKNPMLGPNYN